MPVLDFWTPVLHQFRHRLWEVLDGEYFGEFVNYADECETERQEGTRGQVIAI
jgi:hypothetical protein